MEGKKRRKSKYGILFASAFSLAFLTISMMLRPTTCLEVHAEVPSETFITNVAAPNEDGIYTGEMFELECEDTSPSEWGAYLDSFWTMRLRSLGDYKISKIIINCSADKNAVPHVRASSGVAKVISDSKIEINNVASSNVTLDTDDEYYTIDVENIQVFKEVLHNITFETNGGEFEGELMTTFAEGALAELPTNISNNGLYFDGWYDNKNLSGNPYTSIPENINTDITYWAKWSDHIQLSTNEGKSVYENKYVTVNVNNTGDEDGFFLGTSANATITAKNNKNICKIIYTIGFYGEDHEIFRADVGEWTTNSSAITLTNFSSNTVFTNAADNYLQIKKLDIWLTQPVTLHTNGGTITEGNISEYNPTVNTTLPTKITRTNYVFLGWYDNENFEGSSVTAIAANEIGLKEFWAKWIETAVYNANNLIDALPSLNDVTLDSKDAIEAARTAYDVLTSEQKTKIIHYDVLLNDEAEYFALYFLSETGSICSTGLESDDHSAALSAIWDNLKLQWDQLDSDVKDILISGTATANISDFVARYTHIMERYSDKLTPFSSGPAFVALSNKLPSSSIDSFNSAIIIISVSSIATLIALIAIVCYKRKRLN